MPIISFSIPSMLPMIEAGLRQIQGETVTERVKRQTIRMQRRKMIRAGDTLHLWWRSRTQERRKLGEVECLYSRRILIYPRSFGIYGFGAEGFFPREMSSYVLDILDRDGFDTMPEFFDFFRTSPAPWAAYDVIRW